MRLGKEVTPTQELLVWHCRLTHQSFSQLQCIANLGILPKKLANCRVPECPACRCAKATKAPWQTKATQPKLEAIAKPGQCMSADQLESREPGLIAQLKGRPTRQRHCCATVFVNHFSDFAFVFFHKSITSEETLKAQKDVRGMWRILQSANSTLPC